MVPLERHLYGHPLLDCFLGDSSKRFHLKMVGRKQKPGNADIVLMHMGLFLYVNVDDINIGREEAQSGPMWKRVMKPVDVDKRTLFEDQVYSECTQRECKPNKSLFDDYRKLFESRISVGAAEKLPDAGKVNANVTA